MKDKYIYGRYVLITGASSGIGKAASELFASKGYTVYALSRHCEETLVKYEGGGSVRSIRGDVTDPASIEEAFRKIVKIGIVIHCAGMGVSGSAECTPLEAARLQFDTNYFGVLCVNSFALPKLRENPRSLCIITSSFAGIVPIPFQSHYSSSKYALEAYGEALRMEAKPYGVKVCLVEPGDTKTGFTGARTHNEPQGSPYYEKCTRAVAKMERDELNGKAPETVARAFYSQTLKKSPKVRTAVGGTYKLLGFAARILPEKLKELILAKMY